MSVPAPHGGDTMASLTLVELRRVLDAIVASAGSDFADAVRDLPLLEDSDRKRRLLTHLLSTRQRAQRLGAVVGWSAKARAVAECKSVLDACRSHSDALRDAADRLAGLYGELDAAAAPLYDVPTAAHLGGGRGYALLPTVIEDTLRERNQEQGQAEEEEEEDKEEEEGDKEEEEGEDKEDDDAREEARRTQETQTARPASGGGAKAGEIGSKPKDEAGQAGEVPSASADTAGAADAVNATAGKKGGVAPVHIKAEGWTADDGVASGERAMPDEETVPNGQRALDGSSIPDGHSAYQAAALSALSPVSGVSPTAVVVKGEPAESSANGPAPAPLAPRLFPPAGARPGLRSSSPFSLRALEHALRRKLSSASRGLPPDARARAVRDGAVVLECRRGYWQAELSLVPAPGEDVTLAQWGVLDKSKEREKENGEGREEGERAGAAGEAAAAPAADASASLPFPTQTSLVRPSLWRWRVLSFALLPGRADACGALPPGAEAALLAELERRMWIAADLALLEAKGVLADAIQGDEQGDEQGADGDAVAKGETGEAGTGASAAPAAPAASAAAPAASASAAPAATAAAPAAPAASAAAPAAPAPAPSASLPASASTLLHGPLAVMASLLGRVASRLLLYSALLPGARAAAAGSRWGGGETPLVVDKAAEGKGLEARLWGPLGGVLRLALEGGEQEQGGERDKGSKGDKGSRGAAVSSGVAESSDREAPDAAPSSLDDPLSTASASLSRSPPSCLAYGIRATLTVPGSRSPTQLALSPATATFPALLSESAARLARARLAGVAAACRGLLPPGGGIELAEDEEPPEGGRDRQDAGASTRLVPPRATLTCRGAPLLSLRVDPATGTLFLRPEERAPRDAEPPRRNAAAVDAADAGPDALRAGSSSLSSSSCSSPPVPALPLPAPSLGGLAASLRTIDLFLKRAFAGGDTSGDRGGDPGGDESEGGDAGGAARRGAGADGAAGSDGASSALDAAMEDADVDGGAPKKESPAPTFPPRPPLGIAAAPPSSSLARACARAAALVSAALASASADRVAAGAWRAASRAALQAWAAEAGGDPVAAAARPAPARQAFASLPLAVVRAAVERGRLPWLVARRGAAARAKGAAAEAMDVDAEADAARGAGTEGASGTNGANGTVGATGATEALLSSRTSHASSSVSALPPEIPAPLAAYSLRVPTVARPPPGLPEAGRAGSVLAHVLFVSRGGKAKVLVVFSEAGADGVPRRVLGAVPAKAAVGRAARGLDGVGSAAGARSAQASGGSASRGGKRPREGEDDWVDERGNGSAPAPSARAPSASPSLSSAPSPLTSAPPRGARSRSFPWRRVARWAAREAAWRQLEGQLSRIGMPCAAALEWREAAGGAEGAGGRADADRVASDPAAAPAPAGCFARTLRMASLPVLRTVEKYGAAVKGAWEEQAEGEEGFGWEALEGRAVAPSGARPLASRAFPPGGCRFELEAPDCEGEDGVVASAASVAPAPVVASAASVAPAPVASSAASVASASAVPSYAPRWFCLVLESPALARLWSWDGPGPSGRREDGDGAEEDPASSLAPPRPGWSLPLSSRGLLARGASLLFAADPRTASRRGRALPASSSPGAASPGASAPPFGVAMWYSLERGDSVADAVRDALAVSRLAACRARILAAMRIARPLLGDGGDGVQAAAAAEAKADASTPAAPASPVSPAAVPLLPAWRVPGESVVRLVPSFSPATLRLVVEPVAAGAGGAGRAGEKGGGAAGDENGDTNRKGPGAGGDGGVDRASPATPNGSAAGGPEATPAAASAPAPTHAPAPAPASPSSSPAGTRPRVLVAVTWQGAAERRAAQGVDASAPISSPAARKTPQSRPALPRCTVSSSPPLPAPTLSAIASALEAGREAAALDALAVAAPLAALVWRDLLDPAVVRAAGLFPRSVRLLDASAGWVDPDAAADGADGGDGGAGAAADAPSGAGGATRPGSAAGLTGRGGSAAALASTAFGSPPSASAASPLPRGVGAGSAGPPSAPPAPPLPSRLSSPSLPMLSGPSTLSHRPPALRSGLWPGARPRRSPYDLSVLVAGGGRAAQLDLFLCGAAGLRLRLRASLRTRPKAGHLAHPQAGEVGAGGTQAAARTLAATLLPPAVARAALAEALHVEVKRAPGAVDLWIPAEALGTVASKLLQVVARRET